MKKKFRTSFWWLLSLCILLSACSRGSPGLDFEDGWIRPVPTGMKMTAGFGVLRNSEPEAIEIISFSSPSFGEVSLHRTELLDGISKMREVPQLTIGTGETVVLEPGSYHLMLMMPSGEIQPGQAVRIEMTAADGRSFSFDLAVERR